MHLAGSSICDFVGASQPGKLPGELIEPSHRSRALVGGTCLIANASGQSRCHDCNNQENDERKQFVRLGDLEGIERLDKEEIISEEREDRGIDGRPYAEADRGEQHRH